MTSLEIVGFGVSVGCLTATFELSLVGYLPRAAGDSGFPPHAQPLPVRLYKLLREKHVETAQRRKVYLCRS